MIEENLVERERIMLWFLIPFVASCIVFVSGISAFIMLGDIFFIRYFYLVEGVLSLILSISCYLACFKHKRNAAMVAGVVAIIAMQWIAAILIFVGHDKQKKLDEKFGETWICNSCGDTEKTETFIYAALCQKCAVKAKKKVTNILNEAKEYVSKYKNGERDFNKEQLINLIDNITYIKKNREKFPMLEKPLDKEARSIIKILKSISESEDYSELIQQQQELDEQYIRYTNKKIEVVKNNKIKKAISIFILTLVVLGMTSLTYITVTQIGTLSNTMTELYENLNSLTKL
ncbi:MAG: hypothetical protein ACK5MV_07645 [Aminipila sp.]